MDCCDEIQSKIDSLQEDLVKCRRDKEIPLILRNAKDYFDSQQFVAQVSYNSVEYPDSILVDLRDSTYKEVWNYLESHKELYIYNIYRTDSRCYPSAPTEAFARIVISINKTNTDCC